MRRFGSLEMAVVAVNSLGLLGYFGWLMFGSRRIFYTQDGVLYLLPCLPFFFVFLYLFHRRRQEGAEKQKD